MKYTIGIFCISVQLMACSSALLVVESPKCTSPVSLSPYVAVQDSGKLFLTDSIHGEAMMSESYKLFVIGGSSYETQATQQQNSITSTLNAATGNHPGKAVQNVELSLGVKPSCFYLLFYMEDQETAFAKFNGDLVQTFGDTL